MFKRSVFSVCVVERNALRAYDPRLTSSPALSIRFNNTHRPGGEWRYCGVVHTHTVSSRVMGRTVEGDMTSSIRTRTTRRFALSHWTVVRITFVPTLIAHARKPTIVPVAALSSSSSSSSFKTTACSTVAISWYAPV